MKKLCLIFLGLCFMITTAWTPIQPSFNRDSWSISYIGQTYHSHSYITGIAGYKTIDEPVQLLKMTFLSSEGDKINMVQIVSHKEELDIVGFGFSIDGYQYAIEDTDCDGIFETVKEYNTMVFPPDCFHPTQEIKDALEI